MMSSLVSPLLTVEAPLHIPFFFSPKRPTTTRQHEE
jgi:hypothetical protein